MGDFHGSMLGRNGTDMHDDINSLGQDWQVRPEEDGQLFRTARAPQYPAKCNLPPANLEVGRRLGEHAIEHEEAELACSKFTGKKFSMCVHDIMVSGELEMAETMFD